MYITTITKNIMQGQYLNVTQNSEYLQREPSFARL